MSQQRAEELWDQAEGLPNGLPKVQLLEEAIREADADWANDQLSACRLHHVDILTLSDSSYPSLLKETYGAPPKSCGSTLRVTRLE